MNPNEHRKILMIGYRFDAPEGAPMLHADGTPMKLPECPVKMRIAFWIPMRAPFKRRPVGTFAEYLRKVVMDRHVGQPIVMSLNERPASTVEEYMQLNGIDPMEFQRFPHEYTLVAGATDAELQALRDGVLVEHVQDFTFDRWPSAEELKKHLWPHWERLCKALSGRIPNNVPTDAKTQAFIQFESV